MSQPNELAKPTLQQTALFRLPAWVYRQSIGKALMRIRGQTAEGLVAMDGEDEDSVGSDEAPRAKPGTSALDASRRRMKKAGRGR